MNANSAMNPKVISTRFGNVEYAEYGEGPAVLALHGAMGGYDQSLLLPRTIAPAGFRYIGVSRPGYLGTPLASGEGPEQQADLCEALLDALNIETAFVMGVSGGGPCALNFALRHQARCRGLMLVSTCADIVEEKIPFAFKLTTWLLRFPAFAKAIEQKARENGDAAAVRSIPDPDLRARTLADPEIGPLFRELLASTSDRMAQRIAGTMNDIAITRRTTYPLEQIAVPTLVIHGTSDSVVNYRHATTFATRIPGAELLTIDGGEHVAIFTHNGMVRPRVERFLRQCEG